MSMFINIRDGLDIYSIEPYGQGFWISNDDGEGIEVKEETFFALIDKFFKDNL